MNAQRHTTRAITSRALTIRYGATRTVQSPDLDVRRGEVFALLGPDGIGKCTVRRVLDEVRATSGSVEVFGMDPARDTAERRCRTGVLVGDLGPMGILSGRDVVRLCASVRDCDLEYAEKVADRLRLELARPVGELSAGCRRALGIVRVAILRQNGPPLVVDHGACCRDRPVRPVARRATCRRPQSPPLAARGRRRRSGPGSARRHPSRPGR
jgi:ABC-type multidrug transport system ATPase subunit